MSEDLKQCGICHKYKLIIEYSDQNNNLGFYKSCESCRKLLKIKRENAIKQYLCEECGIKFKQSTHLKIHVDAIHKKLKPFHCEYCDFTCSTKGNLKNHSCYKYENNEAGIKQVERDIQKKMELETGGRSKKCGIGIVDIVSDTEIIEIKNWSNWRVAIGQILSYGIFYPNLKKRIHFFGKTPDDKTLWVINSVLNLINVDYSSED